MSAPQYVLFEKDLIKVTNKYEALSNPYEVMIRDHLFYSITNDLWTDDIQIRSFLGVTLYCEENCLNLRVFDLKERHTVEYISETKNFEFWNIQCHKITNLVTEAATNMKKAIDLCLIEKNTLNILVISLI